MHGIPTQWPKRRLASPGSSAILYLDGKGIRCVATDGPSMGGANPKRALMTYWALGSKGMVGLEYLTNLRELPERAYLLFAAPKIRGAMEELDEPSPCSERSPVPHENVR